MNSFSVFSQNTNFFSENNELNRSPFDAKYPLDSSSLKSITKSPVEDFKKNEINMRIHLFWKRIGCLMAFGWLKKPQKECYESRNLCLRGFAKKFEMWTP